MRNAFFFVSAIAVMSGSLQLAGCGDTGGTGGGGGSGGSGGTGGGGPDVDTACAQFATSVCARLDTCAPFLMELTYGDKPTCEERLGKACHYPVDLPASNLTPANIVTCAEAYGQQGCDQIYDGAPEACRFPGTKDDGESCVAAAECKGSRCVIEPEGTCGECATILGDGETCDPDKDVCDAGLFCDPASTKCEPYALMGEPCAEAKLCKAGLSCNAGKCGAPLADGADCSKGETCDIAVGAVCDALALVCKTIKLAALGEPCGLDPDTGDLVACRADSYCVQQECVARPAEGESCTIDAETKEGNCITGLTCISGNCKVGYPECK